MKKQLFKYYKNDIEDTYNLEKKHGLREGLLIGVIIAASTICVVCLF